MYREIFDNKLDAEPNPFHVHNPWKKLPQTPPAMTLEPPVHGKPGASEVLSAVLDTLNVSRSMNSARDVEKKITIQGWE